MTNLTPVDRITALIKASGRSDRDINAAAHLAVGTLSQARKTGGALTLETLTAYAGVLGVTVAALIGEAPGAGLAGGRAETETMRLPLTQLRASPLNPRKSFDDESIALLADSIAEQGLLQNLVVRENRLPGAVYFGYDIVAGERRFRALKHLAETDRLPPDIAAHGVPVRIVTADDAAHLAMAIVENLQRHDVNRMEEAEGFAQLQALDPAKWTNAAIAQAVGLHVRTVQQRLQLVTALAPALQQDLREGKLRIENARILASVPAAVQLERRELALAEDAATLRQRLTSAMAEVRFAIEDCDTEGLERWTDPLSGAEFFTDRKAFIARQKKAIAALTKRLRAEDKPSFITLNESTFPSWRFKTGGNGIVINLEYSGEVEIYHGRVDTYANTGATPKVSAEERDLAERKQEAVRAFDADREHARWQWAQDLPPVVDLYDALRLILVCAGTHYNDRDTGNLGSTETIPLLAGMREARAPARAWETLQSLSISEVGDLVKTLVAAGLDVPRDRPPHPALVEIGARHGVPCPPILILKAGDKAKEIKRRMAIDPAQLDIEGAIQQAVPHDAEAYTLAAAAALGVDTAALA